MPIYGKVFSSEWAGKPPNDSFGSQKPKVKEKTMKISFADISLSKSGAVALVVPEGATPKGVAADFDSKTSGAVKRAMKAAGFSGKSGTSLEIIAPQGVSASRLVLLGAGKIADLTASALENMGGELVGRLERAKETGGTVILDGIASTKLTAGEAAARVAFGAKLRSYRFDKYKSKKKDAVAELKTLTVSTKAAVTARKAYGTLEKIADGMFLTRDLVNEPSNILFPAEFAKRARALSKVGVKVEVLNEAAMKKLGMGSLLGVGQGSVRESQLVVMRWNGGKTGDKPVAFVGKGVCFDTGGISLKPPAGMEDMKGDMGGAACVTGLMHALAARKAKVNAVGVIGLVENMPDGNAQRPGDIVTSTEKRFQPKFMIDLATLTGAIMIALGKEYAGLFSNDDKLSKQLTDAGEAENEKVWRMPMGPTFDKAINSQFADMKNTGDRYGGSITAAQFLLRFVKDTKWAHLDIAGTAMASPKSSINQSWGSGWGVRLLNRLVADHYEG